MALYSLIFKSLGPMTQIPDSQTIYGVFCHYYKSLYEEVELEDFLEKQKISPSLFISSFFPNGFLPMPIGLQFEPMNEINEQNTILFKLCKKIKYISISVYQDYISNPEKFLSEYYDNIISGRYFLEGDNLFIQKEKDKLLPKKWLTKEMRIRNMKLGDNKQLFYNSVIYANSEIDFQCYLRIENELEIKKILSVFEKMKYISLGGNKSVGYNLFNFVRFEEVKDFNNNSNIKMLLSKSFIDDEINLEESNYKIKVINNKFNGISPTTHRQTVIAILEGSMLKTKKNYSGKLVCDKINDKNIFQNFLGLLI